MREDQPPAGDPITTAPPPTGPTSPAAPSNPSASPYNVTGNPTSAFINAFYPGYSVNNQGQFVYGGSGTGSISNPNLAADYINKLWAPFSQGNYGGFFSALRGNADPTAEAFGSYWPILSQLGFTRPTRGNGQPSDDKLKTPNGQMFDVIRDVGGPTAAWAWNPVTGADGPMPGDGSLTAPFNEPFPTPTGFTPPPFHAPTLDDMLQDPGYQFRMQQGSQALEQSAAARGVLNSGGTLKDLINYGQSAGSQEWSHLWDRNLQAYDRSYKGAYDANTLNYDRSFQKWLEDYNQYRNWQNDSWRKDFDWATA